MIDYKRKVVFIHIPRTGGSSIEQGFGLAKEAREIHHYRADQIEAMVKNPSDYYWFSFVRNPWDRVISAFHQPGNKKINSRTGKSLEYFLQNWDGSSASHEYSRTQNGYLNRCVNVFKFENRKSALKMLGDRFGVDLLKHHIRASKRNPDYKFYYNEQTRRTVAALFNEDIELFNYTYE